MGRQILVKYSPVINILIVRLILAISKIHNLEPKAIDFVVAFLQANGLTIG